MKNIRQVWKLGTCHRCGLRKFISNWFGVSRMCAECQAIANAEVAAEFNA